MSTEAIPASPVPLSADEAEPPLGRSSSLKIRQPYSKIRGMHVALRDLRLERLDVVHGGPHTFLFAPGIGAVASRRLLDDLAPLA